MIASAVVLIAVAALLPLAAAARRARSRWLLLVPCLLLLPLLQLAATDAPAAAPPPANRPLFAPSGDYIGSDSCRACHPGEHATWHDSFHRTMTQPATRATVQPRFESLELDYFGAPVRLQWRGDALWVELPGAGAGGGSHPVVQLTGSHHAQVFWYATGRQRELGIVPMVWRIDERRWLPFPAVFLVPPAAREPPAAGTWNGNCVGCHTTHAEPRLDTDRVDTHAAEAGIACEACHGPGRMHAERNRDPLRRYGLRLGGGADPTIVEPRRLPPPRRSEVCGQCHSISIVKKRHFDSWREHGSPFRPGTVLADSQLVVDLDARDAPELAGELARDPHFFSGKFWPDGLARVTGRELHGLLHSPCSTSAAGERAMTCTSCHRMHQDPTDARPAAAWANAQLDVGMDGNGACLQCHPAFAAADARARHTHHAADSPGSACYDCHMPHTSYGLLAAVRSHAVESPDLQTELATGRPNACNLCHLDRTLAWTDGWLQQWYGRPAAALDGTQRTVAAGPRWLLAGDAGQRALAAWSAGWEAARRASGTDWLAPYLGQLLADPYIAVRIVAARSLRRVPGVDLDGYDELGDADAALRATAAVRQQWLQRGPPRVARGELLLDASGLREADFAALLARRDDRPIFLVE